MNITTNNTPTPDYGELSPCPFCGSPARVADGTGWPGEKIIECSNDEYCRASMTCIWMQKTEQELWNTRAGIPDPAAEIARLREELKQTRKHLAAAGKGAERNAWVSNQLAGKNLELHKENDKLREALNSFDAVDKERNDALKVCMPLLENMHANRNQHKVADYTNEIEAAMAQIKTCYDPHA